MSKVLVARAAPPRSGQAKPGAAKCPRTSLNRLAALAAASEGGKRLGALQRAAAARGPGDVMQRATSIVFATQQLSLPADPNAPMMYPARNLTAGSQMTAVIDPADPPRPGSGPSGAVAVDNFYDDLEDRTGNAFRKGHLLNAKIGGLGVPENLFPITPGANTQHSVYEGMAKAMVLEEVAAARHAGAGAGRLAGRAPRRVKYVVNMAPANAANFVANPAANIRLSIGYANAAGAWTGRVLENKKIRSDPAGNSNTMGNKLANRGMGYAGTGVRAGIATNVPPAVGPQGVAAVAAAAGVAPANFTRAYWEMVPAPGAGGGMVVKPMGDAYQ